MASHEVMVPKGPVSRTISVMLIAIIRWTISQKGPQTHCVIVSGASEGHGGGALGGSNTSFESEIEHRA